LSFVWALVIDPRRISIRFFEIVLFPVAAIVAKPFLMKDSLAKDVRPNPISVD